MATTQPRRRCEAAVVLLAAAVAASEVLQAVLSRHLHQSRQYSFDDIFLLDQKRIGGSIRYRLWSRPVVSRIEVNVQAKALCKDVRR